MDKQQKLDILKQLVNIKTVAANEAELTRYLSQLLNQYGIKNKIIPQFDNRSNLVAEIGHNHGHKLAFAGHADTVHEGDISAWDTDPFTATVKGNNLYGRGVTDMKAGLAAMTIAMIELHEEQVNLSGSLKLLVTISEELTQGGANYLSKLGYVNDLDAVILGEPTGFGVEQDNQHYLVNAHKGALIYTVESFGKAAHSSTPDKGINAIDQLIEYRNAERQLFTKFQTRDDELGTTIYTPDVFHGGQQVNSIPDYAYQQVMVRTIPQLPNQQIIDDLQSLVDAFNANDINKQLKLTVNFSGNPVKTSPKAAIIKISQNVLQAFTNDCCPIKALSIGTDASQFTQQNPNLDALVLGPGNNTAHQTNEYIDIASYLEFIDIYKKITIKYLI
ncbi:ArgE/DapE family deacylase [Apilactobacillus xinyiensis]|uniref:ArgE/DapE family deacylase n=1 Tax=Apilactobacillus xinyiensis TaxID=2841032 RepID=UPI001C7D0012|nr:ArgE/DapE family deacylase [Apilactobacillus xinyiensis]